MDVVGDHAPEPFTMVLYLGTMVQSGLDLPGSRGRELASLRGVVCSGPELAPASCASLFATLAHSHLAALGEVRQPSGARLTAGAPRPPPASSG